MPAPTRTKTGPEVLATDISKEEWFFLITAFGMRPEAQMHEVLEYRKQSLGKSRQEQMRLLQVGLERLRARGLVVQDTDANGTPLTDVEGQPIWVGVGRIVSPMKSVGPKLKLN